MELAIQRGADIAIGSRALVSKDTVVQTTRYRKCMGRLFNGLVNVLILPGIADTQCGFKLFTKQAAKKVFSLQTAERFSFDVEVLFIARKLGFRISEIPVNWIHVPGSKVHLVRDSFLMIRDVLKFRLYSLNNKYQPKNTWTQPIRSRKRTTQF